MKSGESSVPPPAVVSALLKWYRRHARDLPWRRTRKPYPIWVSEIMLQQTQVATVIPYFRRWMRELPSIKALAGAPEVRILKLWEGLGYYRRARNLRAAAQAIRDRFNGRFPHNYDDILSLPGIGRYTAGAIASIAFNRPEPILDGNVVRVLSRLEALKDPPREPAAERLLWSRSRSLVEAAAALPDNESNNCSHLNQALMELGATLCTPKAPRCEACPLTAWCVARCNGLQESLPTAAAQAKTTRRFTGTLILQSPSGYLVRQRTDTSHNAGFWEFPTLEAEAPVDSAATARRLFEPSVPGLRLSRLKPFESFQHSITRFRFTLHAWRAGTRSPRKAPEGMRWVSDEELQALPFTGSQRRLRQKLLRPSPNPAMR